MEKAVLTIITIGLFYSFFCFFYLEDIYRTKNSKPLIFSAFEALVQTIAFFVSLLLLLVIYYCA
jgi:hypothetical protein